MTSLPSTMKGVVITKTGGPEVLEYNTDLPVPTLGLNQILVKNDCVGINYLDIYFRSGFYKSPSMPYIPGHDGEGTIVSAPENTPYGLKVGDRVVYMSTGSYAEYTAVDALYAMKIPDAMPKQTACAALLQGLTALTLIREPYRVQRGDTIMVTAASGGVGQWLCQLLKSIGAKTIATASSEEKRAIAKKLGATVTVGYDEDEVRRAVKEATDGQGVKAVIDGVGKSTFELGMKCLARKGTMISYGSASGAVPPFSISRLTEKNAMICRPTLYKYIATREEYEQYTDELFRFILQDKYDVNIHEIYSLSDVAKAHKDLESRITTGKLLLRP